MEYLLWIIFFLFVTPIVGIFLFLIFLGIVWFMEWNEKRMEQYRGTALWTPMLFLTFYLLGSILFFLVWYFSR
jgi:hypothetical protein